jgi:hypothetical protein
VEEEKTFFQEEFSQINYIHLKVENPKGVVIYLK